MQAKHALTRLEFLVVMGVIIVVVSILLPARSGGSRHPHDVQTTAELKGLASACEAYQTVFGSYPGLYSEEYVANPANRITASENLALSLMGTSVNGGVAGKGPFDASTRRSCEAFFRPRPGDYSLANGLTYGSSSYPLFLDSYGGKSMPILYFRRTAHAVKPSVANDLSSGAAAYYRSANASITDSRTLQSADGTILPQSGFTTTVLQSRVLALGADAGAVFVLISAGEDRIYGTANDIVINGAEADPTPFVSTSGPSKVESR